MSYKTKFSDYDFGIAETDEDIEAFHNKYWGSGDVKMKREALQALLDGKAILFEDGEYSSSIILEDSSLLEGNQMKDNVKAEEAIKEHLLYKRITSWDEERIVLEDGTTLDVECFEQDCCASGGGEWSNVKLDAVITDIKLEDVKTDSDSGYGESWTTAKIMIYHNQNIIAQNDMYTNDGNAGYYYSVTGLLVTLPDNTELKGFEIDC